MSDDQEYSEELRLVRRKKDTVRSKSSKSDEYESDLLRDKNTKSLAGPTESRPVDEEELRRRYQHDPNFDSSDSAPDPAQDRELSPGEQALANALAGVATLFINDFLVPFVREVTLPSAKAKLNERAERRRAKDSERKKVVAKALRRETMERGSVDEAQPESGANLASREPSIPLSRSDFMLAQLQLKLAEEYAAQRRWIIAHAEVKDQDLSSQLERSLSLMLEGRADELDEEQRQAVASFIHEREALLARATDRASDQ